MTHWIPDVVPDQTIESAWGNLIRDRTITPFDDATERTAEIPTPDAGMVTFQLDTLQVEVYTGTGWLPLNRLAQWITYAGVVNFGAGLQSLGSDTSIPGLNVDYTMHVTAIGVYYAQNNNAKCNIRFRDQAATTIQDFNTLNPSPSLDTGRTTHVFHVSKNYDADDVCGIEIMGASIDVGQIQFNGQLKVELVAQ